MRKLKQCPACGKEIYQYAQVCPYCKSETLFASVDDEMAEENEGDQSDVTDGDSPTDAEAQGEGHHGRLGEYVRHLKEDTEKVKQEYEEKIGQRYSRSTIIIGSVIVLLSIIVLCFFIAVQMMEQKTFSLNTTVDNELKAVIDSVETERYQSSTIVAKFPDRDRHSMVYLRDGRLYVFDALTQEDTEIDLQQLNPKAIVDYGGSGVLNASRNSGNTEFGFYRLSANPNNRVLEFIDRGRVLVEKDGYKVSTDVRTASYDANGDRVSGLSSADWEKVAPKTERPKQQQEKKEETVERQAEPVSVTEQMKPSVDFAPKPAVPTVPDKITIKPVKTDDN